MDRRNATTADRPENYLANMTTGGLNMAISRYNDNWKVQRKAAQTVLTPQATNRHLPIQKAEATQLMYDILKTPQVSLESACMPVKFF
jgi:cytochrome P450